MGKKDKRVDAYISKSADFAQPILMHLRRLVHTACPDVKETIKWGFPHFDYHGTMCSMAAFKQHCAFGFWKASLMSDPKRILSQMGEAAMGQFGKLKRRSDLPPEEVLRKYMAEAAKLNREGVKLPVRARPTDKKKLAVPAYFKQALGKNKKAAETFEGFSYTNKKEYIEWVTEAKTGETLNKRLATAIEWMAEGKVRNWKYVRK